MLVPPLVPPLETSIHLLQPCGGERLLLMFDRWRKLLKAFYNEKKRQFDISKVTAFSLAWTVAGGC